MPVKTEIFVESPTHSDLVEEERVDIIEEPLDATDVIRGIEALLLKSRSPQITEENATWGDAIGMYLSNAASYYPHFTHHQTQILFAINENESSAESVQLFRMFEQSLKPEQKTAFGNLVRDSEGDVGKMIISANVLLVVKKAKEFAGKVPFEQAIEFGNEGLVKAVKNYDRSRGVAFSTYATRCITDYILGTSDDESRNIYIPRATLRGTRRAEAIAIDYKETTRKYITDEKLSASLKAQYPQNTKDSRISLMMRTMRGNSMHEISLFESAYSPGSKVSLKGGESKIIIEVFPGGDPCPEAILLEQEERQERIKGALEIMYGKGVTKKEAIVILYRCGLITGSTMILDKVAEILGIARSTAQKRQESFLKKMGLTREEAGLDYEGIGRSRIKQEKR